MRRSVTVGAVRLRAELRDLAELLTLLAPHVDCPPFVDERPLSNAERRCCHACEHSGYCPPYYAPRHVGCMEEVDR